MNERSIEIVREYHFDPKEVIKGLNGYYESDKRNSYITVRRNDAEAPAYLTTALYLSALIEWLREDFDIFYRPGLKLDQIEAARSAAKMCCLRAHIKDEISKRDLWFGADADIPALVDTFFKAYDECGKARDRNRENAVKLSEVNRELRKELNALKDTVSKVRNRLNKKFCTDAKGYYENDLERLVDIAEEEVKKLKEQLDKAAADYQALSEENQKLKYSQKSDINALIRDYCTKNDIIAPSRYFSDKACVEYLFSVVDLKQKNRAAVILQDLYRDIFKKQPNGLSAEDIANKILDRMLETEDLLHKSVDSVNKECIAVGENMVNDYKLSLKSYILKGIEEHGYRYDGLEKKSIEEIVDWIITMATCPRNEWAKDEIENLRGQISRLKDLINVMNEEVKDM